MIAALAAALFAALLFGFAAGIVVGATLRSRALLRDTS